MSRSSVLIVLGLLLMLTPVSGLPSLFRTILVFAFGAAVLAAGVLVRSQDARRARRDTPASAAPGAPESQPEPPVPPAGVSPI